MISETDILLRMLLAAALGALIGLERERQNQPAGLRTHIILTVGAALAMTLSINLAIMFQPLVPNGDPARLAAQVVSGIGFLGAGAILHLGANVKGLTTATSLWTMAIVGLTIGAGQILAAVGTVGLLLVVLTILNTFEKRFFRSYSTRSVSISAEDHPKLIEEFRETMHSTNHQFIDLDLVKDIDNKRVTLTAVLRTLEEPDVSPLVDALAKIEGVKTINIH